MRRRIPSLVGMTDPVPPIVTRCEVLLRTATVLPNESGKAHIDPASGKWKISASLWHDFNKRPSVGRDGRCAVEQVRSRYGKSARPEDNGVIAVTAEDVFALVVPRYDIVAKKFHASDTMTFTVEPDEADAKPGHAMIVPRQPYTAETDKEFERTKDRLARIAEMYLNQEKAYKLVRTSDVEQYGWVELPQALKGGAG